MILEKVIDVKIDKRIVFFKTGDINNPVYPVEMSGPDFFTFRMAAAKEISSREDPMERVEMWECRVGGIYSYDREQQILKSRTGNKTSLEILDNDIQELKKEIQHELDKIRRQS